MSILNWLHLSDFHFQITEEAKWDSNIVLQPLLNDIAEQIKIHGFSPDLVFISGDIAFSGKLGEYSLAHTFFDKLLHITGLKKNRLIIIPGNHDADRDHVSEEIKKLTAGIRNRKSLISTINDVDNRQKILKRFHSYGKFIEDYFENHITFDDNNYFFVNNITINDLKISVLGLNSSWASEGGISDRGHLIIGEKQVRDALSMSAKSDLVIALMHHPFDWLCEFDCESSEALLMDRCDFILRGHLHKAELLFQNTPDTRAMLIAAGSCYETSDYKNGYNFVSLNQQNSSGKIILRAWSNARGGFWTKDVTSYRNVSDGIFHFNFEDFRTIVSPGGDSLNDIEVSFDRFSNRTLSKISDLIPGISNSIYRDEIETIRSQLSNGTPVLFAGDAGTGKSGIAKHLIEISRSRDELCLLLDSRDIGHINDETQLGQFLSLSGPIFKAIKQAGRCKNCLIIIDQLDNIVGSQSAEVIINFIIECSKFEGVNTVVVSRKRESHEVNLLNPLIDAGFAELTCHQLSLSTVEDVLRQIGVLNLSDEIKEHCTNLLHLSLIAKIKLEMPNYDFNQISNEIDLWETYRLMVIEKETVTKDQYFAEKIISESIRLAKVGLNNPDRSFNIDYPRTPEQGRLISWNIIIVNERTGRFYHENLQDFLYSWDASQRELMPSEITNEIPEHRCRNIMPWIQKIYANRNLDLHNRFLEEMFDA